MLGTTALAVDTNWNFIIITVKSVFFTCPLFREFRDPDEFAKITGREYIFYQQSITSDSKNAKIKAAKIIQWT